MGLDGELGRLFRELGASLLRRALEPQGSPEEVAVLPGQAEPLPGGPRRAFPETLCGDGVLYGPSRPSSGPGIRRALELDDNGEVRARCGDAGEGQRGQADSVGEP